MASKPEPLELTPMTISQTSSIPQLLSYLRSTFHDKDFAFVQQILLVREQSFKNNVDSATKECELLKKTQALSHLQILQLKESLKKCEKLVAQLEEDKRVLCDKILTADKRYNKIIEERDNVHQKETQVLLDRIDELKNQKSEVDEKLRVSEEKFSELNGRVSVLEEEMGRILDVDVDVIRKKALDLGIETADRGSASQKILQSEVILKSSSQAKDTPHGVKSVCNSTGNSYGTLRNEGIDNINLVPTKKSCPGDQIFQCGPSACDYAQVDSNYSNKQKDRDHFEEAEPLPNNLAWENGNPTRNSLACEAGDCIKNNLNAVSDKPGSSPVILIIEDDDDDDEMAYASKSSGLGGNLTSPQIREVCAEDSSSLAPKRKRTMSGSENNDRSSFGRQKTIPIQGLVNDVKRYFVGDDNSNPEHSSKVTGVIPKPEQNSVFLRPCEGKTGSKYHSQPPPRRSDKPNGLNNGNDSDSDTDSCSTKNLDMYIASIKESRKWLSEPDLHSAFELDPELCLNAVCALYRRQISESFKAGSQIDEKSIAGLGKYLTDRDHKLKRTASEVDFKYLEWCKTLSIRYCTQLFQLYHSKEDHLFCPGAVFSKL